MASDKDVEITVKVNADGAIQSFDRLGNELKKVEGASSAADVSVKQFLGGFAVGLGAAAAALGAVGVGLQKTFEWAARGSQVGDVAESFDKLSKAAGTTADIFLNQLNAATDSTVSSFDIQKKAIEAVRAGAKPDEFVTLTKAARVLAEETGGNLTDELDKLSNAFETGRVKGLKNALGVIDIEAAENKLAKQLGTTRDALTEEGKVMAHRDAIIEASTKHIAEHGKIVGDAEDAINQMKTALDNQADAFTKTFSENESVNKALGELRDVIKQIDIKQFATDVATLSTALLNLASSSVQGANGLLLMFKDISNASKEVQAKGGTFVDFIKEAFNQRSQREAKDFTDVIINLATKGIAPLVNNLKTVPPAADKAKDSLVGVSASAKKAAEEAAKLKEQLTSAEGFSQYAGKINSVIGLLEKNILTTGEASAEVDKLREAFVKGGGSAEKFAEIFNIDVNDAIDKTSENLDKLAKESARAAAEAAKPWDDFAASLLATAGQALADIGSAIFSGDKEGIKSGLRNAGGSAGGALGEYLLPGFGGPIGQALGDALGKGIFDGINHVFGGRDAQGEMRDTLDKFFASALENNPLQAIIEGQLKNITDLNFGRGTDAFTSGTFDDMFQGLGVAAQQAFSGIAAGFTGLLGTGEEVSSQLAAVLANNLGGSLNNLQLLVESTGMSFEQMRESTVEAFLDGKLSALEAQSALQGIAQIATKGIPDGLGMTKQAFDNLKAAGVKGGRALIDALQDIAYEAKELGIKDFPALQAQLVGTGANADEVKQLFAALGGVGITSIDQLTKATQEQLIPVLAQLQNTQFPFAEQVKTVDELINRVQQLPKQIESNITLNVRTNFDPGGQQLVKSGALGGAITTSSTAQNVGA